MNFDWGLFEFTKLDCARLSKAIGSSRTLQVLHVTCSKMADERGRVLASHILDHPSLRELGELKRLFIFSCILNNVFRPLT